MKLEEIIRKHTLKNAFEYGKANLGSVVGKVIGEMPNVKKDMKKTIELINKAVVEVNKMQKDAVEKELEKYHFEKKEEKEKKIIEAKENVITRFPPEPSGYPHIGHAKAAWLDYTVAEENGGKMILRFDDTNPEKETLEFVDAIKEGLKWLGVKWSEESYTSNNMEKLYSFAEKLIKDGKAYVCTEKQEEMSEMRTSKKPLKDRANKPEDNMKLWNEMKKGKRYVLLFKGDLKSENTVMRDPTLARVIEGKHYKQGDKYKVWPNYDLAVVVMDNLEGITHSMRTKEYELRDELYFALCDALGFKKPELIGFSRLEIKNAPISKRLLKPLVEEKKVMGWDDPRLPTLSGLKRRGILPHAIKDFVLSFGLSKVESNPDYEKLLVFNRKLLDPISKHYFFVPNPVKVRLIGAKPQLLELPLNPKEKVGYREMAVGNVVYINENELDSIKIGEVFRLKDFCNVKLLKKGNVVEAEVVKDEMVPKKLQWVCEEHTPTKILVPKDLLKDEKFDPESLEVIEGYAENDCERLNIGEIVQFERFGFCRLDKKGDKKLTFVFSC
ncbi:MAG: glutamate--tRNA ligase [Candidatus Micrarchaeota archaeon]